MSTTPPRPATPAGRADDARARREFAATHIRDAQRHGPLPRYGTAEWHELPYADPRRWAAIILAAEAWATDGDDLPWRVGAELHAHRQVEAEDAAWFARVAADVRRRAGQPTRAQLQRRRGEIDDQQLADYEAAFTAWVAAGDTTTPPPRLPRAGAA